MRDMKLLSSGIHIFGKPRLRQALVAIVFAMLLAFITLLRPVDLALWSIQSKLFEREPSGEIVLVSDYDQSLDGSVEAANALLLTALERLESSEVTTVFIHTPLRASRSGELDRRLRKAIEALDERAVIARPFNQDVDENSQRVPNAPIFTGIAREASSDHVLDFVGFVWSIDGSTIDEEASVPALWQMLSGETRAADSIQPDYSISAAAIPRIELAAIARGDADALAQLAGKRVLIDGLGGDDRRLKIPDNKDGISRPAILHAIAAETAIRGSGQGFGSAVSIPLFALPLILLLLLRLDGRARRYGYAVWLAMFGLVFAAAAYLGIRIVLSDPLVIVFIYAVQRIISHWRRRHLFVDPRSGLPNFNALQRDLEAQQDLDGEVVVVTKIARLDAIFATLKADERGEYLRQIASRLVLGEVGTSIFHDGGKYFAMVLRQEDYPDLHSHLEGLRAIASQAVVIGERSLDVAMTVGVDRSTVGSPMNRLSSAIAAADQAREAYRPVFMISDFATDSEEWDYSLQSRLESALSENRISIKLQPKVDMQSGRFVGAEALARWTDRERGEIPPNRFILQCERAGRLDDLTRRVMSRSFAASRELDTAGLPARVSVNVSAIQFVDSRIVELVEEALAQSCARASNMIIEVTETARIEDLATARDIMERIGRLGIEFSIDDFGVGSGNLDALYSLPFSELKIDRMFANEVTRCVRARKIVASLMGLSRDLGIASVAEGIDDLATFDELRDMGGDLAQGFCIARPQTLPLFKETLRLQVTQGLSRSLDG